MNITKENFSKIDTTDLLPHHDVVFRAPVCDPVYGLPIGSGSMGCLLYLSEEALHLQLNHTDLLDDIATVDYYDHKEDETHSVVRNGAEFVIDFGMPVFDTIYQNKFEGRISLADATAKINADTPFCRTDIAAFASERAQAAVVSMCVTATEEMALRAKLKRWGSRTFQFWYGRYDGDASIGLSGADAKVYENAVCVTQKLGKQYFALAVLPALERQVKAEVCTSHTAEVCFDKARTHKIDFYISFGFGTDCASAQTEAFACAKKAAQTGKECLYAAHKAAWASFWNKSYVALPQEDDYIENLWYLNLYYANSEMKGKYPPHFCNGIWGFNHDFVPWNLYFHYNTQHMMNALSATNHPELLNTYFNFRKKQLPQAKYTAQVLRGGKGAHYSDISDMAGRMMLDKECLDNCTCGAQIALLMYKNYRYTGDEDFLRETALPVMREVGAFYLDLLKKGADGKYHIENTSAYEGSPCFDDCITDLVHIRILFNALIDILDENEAAPYRERLENLVGFTAAELDADETEDGKFVHGLGKGRAPKGNKVLTVGTLSKTADKNHRVSGVAMGAERLSLSADAPMRKTFGTPEKQNASYYGFPDAEMSPVYPAGLVGIKDKDSEIYNMIYNSIQMHAPAPEARTGAMDRQGVCTAWCMMPIYMARMGMASDLRAQLKRSASTWLVFPQGLGADANFDNTHAERWAKGRVLNIRGKHGEEVIRFNHAFFLDKPELFTATPHWKFRRFNYETLPILACAVNEMLLQSYDGSVRLFGAVEKGSSVSFKLAAEGGFTVSAVYENGEFAAQIESARGEDLKLIFENAEGEITFTDVSGKGLPFEKRGDAYCLSTEKGMKIMAQSKNGALLSFAHDHSKNTDVKWQGTAQLGTPKEY